MVTGQIEAHLFHFKTSDISKSTGESNGLGEKEQFFFQNAWWEKKRITTTLYEKGADYFIALPDLGFKKWFLDLLIVSTYETIRVRTNWHIVCNKFIQIFLHSIIVTANFIFLFLFYFRTSIRIQNHIITPFVSSRTFYGKNYFVEPPLLHYKMT